MASDLNEVSREFFTVHYSQALSPNEKFIALSNNLAQLKILPIYETDPVTSSRMLPMNSVVFSTLTHTKANLLLTGAENGQVCAYDWTQLLEESAILEPTWTVSSKAREINSLCAVNESQSFAVGYGDGSIEVQDFAQPEKVVTKFTGHGEQVNQIASFGPSQFVSCSSDGTVHLYDTAVGPEPVKRVNISAEAKVVRTGHSRAVLAIGVQDRFVVCGGGVDLAKFDLSSGSLLQVFEGNRSSDVNFHSIDVSSEKIGVGVSNGAVLGFSHGGRFVNEIPITFGPVLNLTSIDKGRPPLLSIVSGLGAKVSAIVNYGYVSYSLPRLV